MKSTEENGGCTQGSFGSRSRGSGWGNDSTAGSDADSLPLFSVLNTVVDYRMRLPTPLEPDEYQDSSQHTQDSRIRVPVLRVFGPIMRGDSLHNTKEPLQSACLFIHGAFPYLIARPVVAGPDGSVHRSSHREEGPTLSGRVDWDSVESVEGIVDHIKINLEATIQSSFEIFEEKISRKVIRCVSVVSGRGFYTYCPGPPAPFLRVEYYDPGLRWKVKLALERGLELPSLYHPDPLQYNATLTPPSPEKGRGMLQFHCYEAHIPHTMQFFKDFNLAGMSYIHLSDGKFRHPLPRSHRARFGGVQTQDVSNSLFLDSNTPQEHRWRKESPLAKNGTGGTPQLSVGSHTTLDTDPPWTRKETSSDVEVDVSVEHILNVKMIMTSLPSNQEEREQIHWRAVPSLREIWRQERRRMSRLLKPKDDFLSCTPAFTLNVKKGAPVPGSRLAVFGMRRLIRVSCGLETHFERAMRQIAARYSESVQGIDSLILGRSRQLQNGPKNTNDRGLESEIGSTPGEDEAIDALGALAAQFEEHGNASGGSVDFSSSQGTNSQFIGPSQNIDMPEEGCTHRSEDNYEEMAEIFSQRVDRGESVIDSPFHHLEDYIDPNTLTPYQDPNEEDEEDEISENDLEHSLNVLATQTLLMQQQSSSVPRPSIFEDGETFGRLDSESEPEEENLENSSQSSPSPSPDNPTITSDGHDNGLDTMVPPPMPSKEPFLGKVIEAAKQAPSRGEVTEDSFPYFKIESSQATPTWLPHSSQYNALKSQLPSTRESLRLDEIYGVDQPVLQPTICPPSRREVEAWCRKMKKTRKSTRPVAADGAGFRIDENTRKLVSTHKQPKKRKRDNSAQNALFGKIHAVEEVERESSQLFLSMSQSQSNEIMSDGNQKTPASQIEVRKDNTPVTELSSPHQQTPLEGIGQIGGRIYVEGGGGLKAVTKTSQDKYTPEVANSGRPRIDGLAALDLPTPLTMMSLEIHVQCRSGKAGLHDSKEIAMKPNPEKDKVSAVVYVYARDPGGGAALRVLERGCLFVPIKTEENPSSAGLAKRIEQSLPRKTMGIESAAQIEAIRDERQLLLRLASIVRWKDPDMLVSWDPQGAGLGYLIERGAIFGSSEINEGGSGKEGGKPSGIDMVRLLGRNPTSSSTDDEKSDSSQALQLPEVNSGKGKAQKDTGDAGSRWQGSGLGAEWDERVGAGAAAASIVGRLVFAGWKLIAEEVKHSNASYLPAMVATVLKKRIPFHDDLQLTRWYSCSNGIDRWRVLHHRLAQAMSTLLMFDVLDVVGRAGEAARLSGVEFSQSFPGIRGSQYKVEGVLLRALKSISSDERGSKRGRQDLNKSLSSESNSLSPWKMRRKVPAEVEDTSKLDGPVDDVANRKYFFYSPSVQDTNNQEALEVQALTLEPKSGYQKDPVVVCDFTALYPSLIIAYNLCYSTCAGKLEYHSTRSETRQGKTTGKVGPFRYAESRTATVLQHHVKSIGEKSDGDSQEGEEDHRLLNDRAYVVPTGTLFVSEGVLKGVLPLVLDEILSTRAMVKKAAKQYKKFVPSISSAVLRQLEARQLALKYIANVSYGYTSATFSGRCAMPLLADAIVECARRTLTNAIIKANEWGKDKSGKWYGAEVLYGDTDSVFVKLPGRTVKEAFEFGESFCKAVTESNPPPVQLKLEKVYHGSILQTKKRYCGMKYESKDQKKSVFEAKGIETVRRDQCALTQKVLRNALITLFRRGLGDVKAYLYRQWNMILAGHVSVSDFILTGRVRSKYRNGGVGPVQAVLARRLAEADPGRVVRHKERVAYVVVATPGITFRLRDCVLTPTELLEQWDAYTIHSAYYLTRHVNAALGRCLGLTPLCVDMDRWYETCPKPRRRIHFWPVTRSGSNTMISSYFGSETCSLCGQKCKADGSARAVVCQRCHQDPVKAATDAMNTLNNAQKEAKRVASACSQCNGFFEDAGTFAALKRDGAKGSIIAGQEKSPPGIVTPFANCTCIDCPKMFERHRLREIELEAAAVCKALDLV